MIPFGPPGPDGTPIREGEMDITEEFDVEVAVDVSTDATEELEPPAEAMVASYLVRFVPDVSPAEAESVLGRLEPPEEGIVLAASGAVIVRASRSFVEAIETNQCVEFVHRIQMQQWEPKRYRVPEETD